MILYIIISRATDTMKVNFYYIDFFAEFFTQTSRLHWFFMEENCLIRFFKVQE